MCVSVRLIFSLFFLFLFSFLPLPVLFLFSAGPSLQDQSFDQLHIEFLFSLVYVSTCMYVRYYPRPPTILHVLIYVWYRSDGVVVLSIRAIRSRFLAAFSIIIILIRFSSIHDFVSTVSRKKDLLPPLAILLYICMRVRVTVCLFLCNLCVPTCPTLRYGD